MCEGGAERECSDLSATHVDGLTGSDGACTCGRRKNWRRCTFCEGRAYEKHSHSGELHRYTIGYYCNQAPHLDAERNEEWLRNILIEIDTTAFDK